MLQGIGDSRTSLLFLCIAAMLSIGFDLLGVLVFPLGMAGATMITMVAQFPSWLFGIVHINRKYPGIAIRPFALWYDGAVFRQMVQLGIPSGLQQALFSFAIMVLTRPVDSYGFAWAVGYAAGSKQDSVAFIPIASVGAAITTYTGQNSGTGAYLFARCLSRDAMHFNSLAALAITVPYFLSGKWRGKIITQARAGYM